MKTLRTCVGLLAIAALAGCSAASQTSPTSQTSHTTVTSHTTATSQTGAAAGTGHLTGRFVMEGGPISPNGQQPGERPLPGTVTLTTAGQRPVTIQVGASGRFSVWLPPGRYQVSGRTPNIEQASSAQVGSGATQGVELPCSQSLSVTITAGHTAAITLTCIVP